jgi:hypothetical protein
LSVSFRGDSITDSDWRPTTREALTVAVDSTKVDESTRDDLDQEEEEAEEEEGRIPTPSDGVGCLQTGDEIWLDETCSGKLSCTNQQRRRRSSSSLSRLTQSFSIIHLIETTREVLV